MKKRGVGVASSFQGVNYHFGHPDVSHATLEVTDDDAFVIHTAASDLGQGLEAALIQIVSDSFGGLPTDWVRWASASTGEPDAGSTGASRQTTLTGNAVWQACETLKARLRGVLTEMLEVAAEDVEFAGKTVRVAPDTNIPLRHVLGDAREKYGRLEAHGRFEAPPTTPLDDQGKGEPINQFAYATHVAEVEVDTDTGEVTVLRVAAYTDAGRILHRIGAEGQVEGGVVMGLGFALTEDYMLNQGEPVNTGFTNYLIPTVYDSPTIEAHFVDQPVPMGKLGVKGLAEIPVATIAPAICNAIYDATGARITRLPATPERVLAALRQADSQTDTED